MIRRLAAALGVLALICLVRPAWAWIETHVVGNEVRVRVEPSGEAVVELRVTLTTKGTHRLQTLEIRGVDADAVPVDDAYVVLEEDALGSSLESAIPVKLSVTHPPPGRGQDPREEPPAVLVARVDDTKGLPRGKYVFVVRYRTDLKARGAIVRDGALVRIEWTGPRFDDGFDNTRTTFVVPSAPVPPRALEAGVEVNDEGLAPTFLSEIRRGHEHDEIELLRTYAPKDTAITWAIRVDQRALAPLPRPTQVEQVVPPPRQLDFRDDPVGQMRQLVAAGALFVLYTLLVWLRARQVARVARARGAIVPPALRLPTWLRAPLAGAALTGGVALQLVVDRPFEGACAVVLATLLAAHGTARVDTAVSMRGPGQWLAITQREAWGRVPRPEAACLDGSTSWGKALLVFLLGGVGAASYAVAQRSMLHGVLVGLDAVAIVVLFATGRQSTLPPHPMVGPAVFLKRLAGQLDKAKGTGPLRISPRIRVPLGEVDPDELRLSVVPRVPLRGFVGIEVGISYALGLGARVAMPEVLLRVVQGSPCEEAVRQMARSGRATPGRKLDERVLAFAPRLPTVAMTAKIVAALAVRVTGVEAPVAASKRRRRKTPAKAA